MDTKSEELDLNVRWTEVCESFYKTSQGQSLKRSPMPSPDQIAAAFTRKAHESKTPDKWKKLGKFAANVGAALLQVGSIAAQAASMAFGPSEICMNAVSFFVDAAVRYKKIFDTLEQIFEEMSEALKRFNLYRENQAIIDAEMKRRANVILIQFVKVCDSSYKVLKKQKTLWLTSTLFKDDGGVSNELDELKKMTAYEADARSTLAYISGKKTEKITTESHEILKTVAISEKQVLDKFEKQESKAESERQLASLFKKLLTPDLNMHKEKNRSSLTLPHLTPDAGLWVSRLEKFSQWADPEDSERRLLLLSGHEGGGKTVIVSKLISILEQRHLRPKDGARKVLIAYFYCGAMESRPTDARADRSKTSGPSLDFALRTLAMQIASSEEVYRNSLKNYLTEDSSLSLNVDELWETLFVRSAPGADLFLFLDDAHELEKELLPRLFEIFLKSSAKTSSRIQLLVSARSESLGQLIATNSSSYDTINVSADNPDIAAYVDSRVDKISILSGKNEQLVSLRQSSRDTLSKLRSFRDVEGFLDQISKAQRPKDIQDLLQTAKSGVNSVLDRLEKCNALPQEDVQDLNQLLEWTITAIDDPTLTQLEAVLHTRRARQATSSFRPLRERIQSEFTGLFSLIGREDDRNPRVQIGSEILEEHFRKLTEENHGDSQQLSEMPITELEVKIVRRFLRNLCDEELYTKFEFEDFFQNKLSKTDKVHVNTDEMNGNVMLDCLRVILQETDADVTKPLRSYTDFYWLDHLIKMDLSLASQNLKGEVGKRLAQMFVDEGVLGRWEKGYELGFFWCMNEEHTKKLLRWVQDLGVNRHCPSLYKDWVDKVCSPPSTASAAEELWRPMMRLEAKRWLLGFRIMDDLEDEGDDDREATNSFGCVRAFHKMVSRRQRHEETKLSHTEFWDQDAEVDEIEEVTAFARTELSIEKSSYVAQWHLGETFFEFKHFQEAKNAFEAAVDLHKDHWEASRGLALTFEKLGDTTTAIELLQAVIVRLKEDEDQSEKIKKETRKHVRRVAEWHRSSKLLNEALNIYEDLLKTNPSDYETICDLLTVLDDQGNHEALTQYLDDLKAQKSADGSDRLGELLIALSSQDAQHHMIMSTSKHANYLSTVTKSYRKALELAEERTKLEKEDSQESVLALLDMCWHTATLLHRYHGSESHKSEAIELWRRSLKLRPKSVLKHEYRMHNRKYNAVLRLGIEFISTARAAISGSEMERSSIAKFNELNSPDQHDWRSESADWFLPKDSWELLLGSYFAEKYKTQEAKEKIKPRIQFGIDLLSDDDKDNDWYGFLSLANAFQHFRDDDSALVAMSLIAPINIPTRPPAPSSTLAVESSAATVSENTASVPREATSALIPNPNSETNSLTTATTTEPDPSTALSSSDRPELKHSATSRLLLRTIKPKGPMNLDCEGDCGHNWTFADDIYMCRQCPHVSFERSCLDKMRKGELAKFVCDPSHDFFHVPKWDFEGMGEVPRGCVRVGEGRIVGVEEWLDGIREEWGIEKEKGGKNGDEVEGKEAEDKEEDGGVEKEKEEEEERKGYGKGKEGK